MGVTSYLIAIGSNRPGPAGGPRAMVSAAMAALPGVTATSPIVDSAPVGPSQRRYANAAVLIASPLSPAELLVLCKAIEARFGRRRGRRWGTRPIDLDIILWSGGRIAQPGLTIPHPAYATRRFVLDPLLALAPDWRDPASGLRVRHLHARLTRARAAPSQRRVGP